VKHRIKGFLVLKSLTFSEVNYLLGSKKAFERYLFKRYLFEGDSILIKCILFKLDDKFKFPILYAILVNKKIGKAWLRNLVRRKIREILVNSIRKYLEKKEDILKEFLSERRYAVIFIVKLPSV